MFETLRKAQQNAYGRKHISCDEQVKRFFPRKYRDYRTPVTMDEVKLYPDGLDCAVVADVLSVQEKEKNGRTYVVVKARDMSGTTFNVTYLGMRNVASWIASMADQPILFRGVFKYNPTFGFSAFNAEFYSDIVKNTKIVPVYSNIKGVADKTLKSHIFECVKQMEEETLPAYLRGGYPEVNDAIHSLHYPKAPEEIESAERRMVLDDLVYLKLESELLSGKQDCSFRFGKTDDMERMIASLPYSLTGDQRKTIDSIIADTAHGQTVRALIQGDVGCGKTIIAFSLMRCAAENGFQSILMAPTQILAMQHYEALMKLVPENEIGFFSGSVSKKEKDLLARKVKTGEIK